MDQPLSQERSGHAVGTLVIEPTKALEGVKAFVSLHVAEIVSGCLLAAMCLQMFVVIWRKSITVDELVLIPSAYYHLADGDFQQVHEHPPFPKLLAAIPLLFVQPEEYEWTPTPTSPDPTDAKWVRQSQFWNKNLDRVDSISFWSRVPMILLTVGLGLLIFKFTKTLFGKRAAVFAVALFSLEPTLTAHGRVVHTDVPAAFGFVLFFMALYSYTKYRNWRWASLLGAAAAVAILSKYSMLMIGFIIAVFFIVNFLRSASKKEVVGNACVVLLTIVVLINAAYFFKHNSVDGADEHWISIALPNHARSLTVIARTLSHLLPKEFVLGVLYQFWHNNDGHAASLLGMYSQKGWWYYFPVAFALKTTIPFLLLSIASIVWGILKLVKERDMRFVWLLVPTSTYMLFVLFSHIDIGVRYLLPIFPFLCIGGAAVLDHICSLKQRAVALILVVIVVGWIGVEAFRAFPNHMVYMNQLARNAPHWWYLSDSNVEWGDDTRDLAKFLKSKGESRVIDGTLGGFGILRFYDIESVNPFDLPNDHSDLPRYIAVGASCLNGSVIPFGAPGSGRETETGRVNFFKQYRTAQPEAIIGGSIYVFRVQ
jgi:hypothetical protein